MNTIRGLDLLAKASLEAASLHGQGEAALRGELVAGILGILAKAQGHPQDEFLETLARLRGILDLLIVLNVSEELHVAVTQLKRLEKITAETTETGLPMMMTITPWTGKFPK